MEGIRSSKWKRRYEMLLQFVREHQRYPSRHHVEEHQLLNWLKYNRKLINKGELDPERVKLIEQLQSLRASVEEMEGTCQEALGNETESSQGEAE